MTFGKTSNLVICLYQNKVFFFFKEDLNKLEFIQTQKTNLWLPKGKGVKGTDKLGA